MIINYKEILFFLLYIFTSYMHINFRLLIDCSYYMLKINLSFEGPIKF